MIFTATISIPKEAMQKIEKKASIATDGNMTATEVLEIGIAEFLIKTHQIDDFGAVVVDID